MYSMSSINQQSRSVSNAGNFSSVMSTSALPVMTHRSAQGTQQVNSMMCCMQNSVTHPNNPPSRMISAANLSVLPVNPSRFTTQTAELTPAAIVAQPERQITEPLKHKQTFIYGGVETLEAEDCGWLEPIKLKVHAMEVQQYIEPNNPDAKPVFIYNVDHLKECVETPENWAPESVTGVPALTFDNLNTNTPKTQYPLRLTSENSLVGENNPYIQPIHYYVQRIHDIPENNEFEQTQIVEEPEKNINDNRRSVGSFLTTLFNKFKPADKSKENESIITNENNTLEEANEVNSNKGGNQDN